MIQGFEIMMRKTMPLPNLRMQEEGKKILCREAEYMELRHRSETDL